MFSMNRRWFFAIKTSLLKARGHRKGQKRFRPVAAVKRQNLAGFSRLPKECGRRAAGRPAGRGGSSTLPLCTHLHISAAVQNRDEKNRMREDMKCN